MRVTLSVNGERYELDVSPVARLADVLRDDLGLAGTKIGCGEGACGACAVLVDGRSVNSCLLSRPRPRATSSRPSRASPATA